MVEIIGLICAYFVGAIPTGAWLTRIVQSVDITRYGSGNAGATNVARLLGVKWFFVVLIIDALKAYAVIRYFCDDMISSWYCVALACALLIGNGYSVFLGGKGGKGIATASGIIAAFSWQLMIIGLMVWLTLGVLLRNVGIASVSACCAVMVACFFFNCSCVDCTIVIVSALWCIWRHQKNIVEYVRYLQR